MEDSLVNRTSRESAEALFAAAPERTLHLRGLRDACRSGQVRYPLILSYYGHNITSPSFLQHLTEFRLILQDTQSQIWSSEGDATWTLLQTAFSVWDDDDLSEEDTVCRLPTASCMFQQV